MRTFKLDRARDVNGNSGIGLVAEGVQFSNGRVVIQWLSTVASTAVFDSMSDLIRIHCRKGHETGILWDDESEYEAGEAARCRRCTSPIDHPLDYAREHGLYYHLKCWSSLKRDRLQRQRVADGTHDPQHSVTKREMWEHDAESTGSEYKEMGELSQE